MTPTTLLFRQVNPSWVQQGRVTSQVFKPTGKDRNQLSAYDGDLISAEKSWVHYTTGLELQSVGVLAVTLAECQEQQLPVTPDPARYPEHVLISFSGLTRGQIEKAAKWLKLRADLRGWQYQAGAFAMNKLSTPPSTP